METKYWWVCRMRYRGVFISKWDIYVPPLPPKVRGWVQKREQKDCENRREWISVAKQHLSNKTAQLHTRIHKAETTSKWLAFDQVKGIPSTNGCRDDDVQPLAEELLVADHDCASGGGREGHFCSERQALRVCSYFSKWFCAHEHIGNTKWTQYTSNLKN